MTGVDIRASTNFTGNEPDGDWILESDNVDVRQTYFTDAILSWTGVLGPAYSYMRFITTYLQDRGALTMLGELFVFGKASGQTSDFVYPPRRAVLGDVTLTSDTDHSVAISGQAYGNGTYRITTSTTGYPGAGAVPWKIFDNATGGDDNVWYSSESGMYADTSGGSPATTNAALTTVGGVGVRGEWIQVQFPAPIDFGSVLMWNKNDLRIPIGMVFAVSNDGTTWSNYYTATFNDDTQIVNTFNATNDRWEATVVFPTGTPQVSYISRISRAVIAPVPRGAAVPPGQPRFVGFGGGFIRGKPIQL
jgi:hypothetical protein